MDIPELRDAPRKIIIDDLIDKRQVYRELKLKNKDKDVEEIIRRLEKNIESIITDIQTIDNSTLLKIIHRNKDV